MPKPDYRRRGHRPPVRDNRAPRSRAGGSIRARLLKLFTAVLGAISFFVFLFFPATIGNEATKGLDERAHAIAQMAAFSVGPAVYFDDEQAIVESLGGALQDADIDQVRILDRDGATLVSLVAPDAGAEDSGPGAESGATYEVYVPVYFSDEEIGQVRLLVSRQSLRARVAAARRLVGLISLAIFMAGLISVLTISHRVTKPLAEVSAIARRIANGELDVRASREYEGEVAQLAGAFNHMMDQVESAHSEVQGAKAHLEQVLDNLPAEVAMFDPGQRYLYVNPAGMSDSSMRARAIGQSPVEFRMGTGAGTDSAMETEEALRTCIGERRGVRLEQEWETSDGGVRHFLRSYSPIVDQAGEVINVIACGIEISDLREAESALLEAQQQLAQAQKMESVGRLAGGIAHDFNNLLVSITGHVDLMLLDLAPDGKTRQGLEEMRDAANQARSLTRQLLTFSRKEIRQPRVLDLNDVVRHSAKMLGRVIRDGIDLCMKLSDGLGSVEVDPGQIDQVIVNLVLNARDAMKTGGTITIRSQAIEFDSPMTDEFGVIPPGRYVVLSVADTGIGMDEATRSKIFDPFFTTKGPAEGTGLGLATAHGIVTQSEGFMRVYSEPGMGATFKIFLPVVDAGPEALFPERPEEALAAGTETILVVEDQETVRSMVRAIPTSFSPTW
jgi:PAS domain S-box-containing protein